MSAESNNEHEHHELGAVIATKGPLKRVVAIIFLVTLCLFAIFVKALSDARNDAHQHAVQVAERLLTTLNAEIARNIENVNLSLEGLIENLKYPEIVTVTPEFRQALLFARTSSAKNLHAITLIDENGIVRLDSRTPFPKPESRADRDYFLAQKNSRSSDLYISAPYYTPQDKQHVIAISRKIVHADGTFAGVAVGMIRLSYFIDLMKHATLGTNGNISLVRADGLLLARWPFKQEILGSNLRDSTLFEFFPRSKSGHFETNAVTDGVRRVVVYSQIQGLPLILGVGQSTADIFAQWQRNAITLGSLLSLLGVISGLLTLYLLRAIKRRSIAEETLAKLAIEDSLTGLANRRHFAAVLDREWRRASRERVPIAAIMCDTDHFKRYNDTYGHQAGDKLLQAIGAALKQSIRRGTDLAARYGGDEFIVLLPGTDADGARQIAEQIRAHLAAICEKNSIPPATMSIGVASLTPQPNEDRAGLLTLADEAAYKAKSKGRDRVELAASRNRGPAPAETMLQQSAA